MASDTNRKSGKGLKNLGLIKDIRDNPFSYIIALPAIIYVLIYSYLTYPYIAIAFQRYSYQNNTIFDILFRGNWVGLRNFRFFFESNQAFRVTANTLILNILFITFGTLTAVALAILVSEMYWRKAAKVSQSVMLFPNYISWVIISFILTSFLSTEHGLINKALVSLGYSRVNWYTEAGYWRAILVVLNVWKGAGMSSIIYLAAIAGIDNSLYEVAMIDGATRWQRIRFITIPMITPTILILTLLSIGKIMYGDFGMIYALVGDNGTLYRTTDIIDTYIFRSLRQVGDPAQSMAIGLFQSVIGFVMVFGSNALVRKVYPDGALY